MKTLFEAVGPEQVSPHYESLSRSRRGLLFIFAYIGTINTISRFGGWSHNEWIRGMIFHHEFLIAFYLEGQPGQAVELAIRARGQARAWLDGDDLHGPDGGLGTVVTLTRPRHLVMVHVVNTGGPLISRL